MARPSGSSQDTAERLRSALEGAAADVVTDRAPGAVIGGKTGWVPPALSSGEESAAWFISYARLGQGRLVAFAVHVGDPDSGIDESDGSESAVRVAERMRKATS
ncbi:penicillin-binding transpeptidase domain-containing protein [Streptomyces sp. NPDC126933]|uniref:penicillin-binding transpeptidase domain-containing protein n=1 Tax=unclassified Streptomyces TaxID=2593676 RepID=UPI003650D15F